MYSELLPEHLKALRPLHRTWLDMNNYARNALTQIQCQVHLHAAKEDKPPLVLGATLPSRYLSGLLGHAETSSYSAVVFLPDEVAHYAQGFAYQVPTTAVAWDITRRVATAYICWNLLGPSFLAPNVDTTLKSQMWIPAHSMEHGFTWHDQYDYQDPYPKVHHTAFVTSTEIWISRRWISPEDVDSRQALAAIAAGRNWAREFSTEEVAEGQIEAKMLGTRWPWMEGVWPINFERNHGNPSHNANVVGGFLFEIERLGLEDHNQEDSYCEEPNERYD